MTDINLSIVDLEGVHVIVILVDIVCRRVVRDVQSAGPHQILRDQPGERTSIDANDGGEQISI